MLSSPDVPGVTMNAAFPDARKLPDVQRILATTKPMSDERARALTKLQKDWSDAHKWYRRENVKIEAYLNGAQYGFINERTGLWEGNTLDKDVERVRLTGNIMKPLADTATSMLTQDAPIFLAVPGRSGVAAKTASACARAFCDNAWNFHKLDDVYRGTGRGMFCGGTDWVLLEIDKLAGPPMPVIRPDGSPVMEEVPDEEATEPTPDSEAAEGEARPSMPQGVAADGSLVTGMGVSGVGGLAAAGATGAPLGVDQDLSPPVGHPPRPLRPKIGPQGELKYRRLQNDQVDPDPASTTPGGTDGVGIFVSWNEANSRIYEMLKSLGREAEYFDLPENEDADVPTTLDRTQRVSPGEQGDAVKLEGSRRIRTLYLRSRAGRQRGDCMVFISGKMIYEGENDIYPTQEELANGELWPSENWPAFHFIGDERKNNPWGRGRMVDVIPHQDAVNGYWSKDLQHAALIANVKYVLPAGFDWEPNDAPGQVARPSLKMYQMTGGHPVQMTQPPQMPEYRQGVEAHTQAAEYACGVNAATMGNAPSAQPSGRLTQSLQERDNTRIAPIKRSLDNQWGRIQTYALRLIRRHFTGERQLRIVGEDMSVEMRFFKVAEMSAGTEVVVLNDSSLPRDPQRRILAIQNIVQMLAQIPTPELQDAVLELLRLPDLTDWLQRRSPHQMAAQRLCAEILSGEEFLPLPCDNALIFKAEIERFWLSGEVKSITREEKVDPANQGQSPLEQRITRAWMYYTQKAMPAPPAAPAMPGAPAAPGAPPQSASPQPPMAMAA